MLSAARTCRSSSSLLNAFTRPHGRGVSSLVLGNVLLLVAGTLVGASGISS
ncbi:MAG: hypothetical protein R2717_08615 [Schumannella sp.]